MSRRAKKQEAEETVVHLTNGPQPADYQRYVERIENVQADIDAIDEKKKRDKEPFQHDIKALYDEAEAVGINKKALKHVVAKRRKLLKAKQAFENLDLVDRSDAVSIEAALGPFAETELGQAAVTAATQ
jgi:uncharacterized protein (UPF0335 family)